MAKQIPSDYILTSVKDGVRVIQFNRPEKKNALCTEMYEMVTKILNEDATNDSVVVTVFTGSGEWYSSGNDLNVRALSDDFEADITKRIKIVEVFVAAFINYPKLLIAVVNGPAIGVAVTTLALCDIVYASDRATFATPFINLGLCPEGCSSYLFPRIMGRSKASEVLILGNKLKVQEAYNFGFISEIVPHEKLGELFQKLQKYGKLPVNSMKRAKRLITDNLNDQLHVINKRELAALRECFNSDEFFEGLNKFMSRKSKL